MVCVFSDGKKGKHKWWTKVILLTKLKVWRLYYSLDLILNYELGRLIWFFYMLGELVVHEEHEHGSIGGLCMFSASSVLNVLKTSILCFRAASAVCKKNNRSFLLCVSHYWLTPPWILLAIPFTSPRGWGFKWPRIILLGVSTLIFILWNGSGKLMALCRT